MKNILFNDLSFSYFKNSYTTDLIIDSNSNFWVTTLKDGVFVMPNLALKKIPLPNDVGITAIEKTDQKDLYFATSDFNIFNYSKTNHNIEKIDVAFRNNIYGICYNALSKDLLMVATTESVFYNSEERLNKKSKLIVTKSITVYDDDQYLVSLPHALSIYSKKRDSLSLLRQTRSYGSVFHTHYIFCGWNASCCLFFNT